MSFHGVGEEGSGRLPDGLSSEDLGSGLLPGWDAARLSFPRSPSTTAVVKLGLDPRAHVDREPVNRGRLPVPVRGCDRGQPWKPLLSMVPRASLGQPGVSHRQEAGLTLLHPRTVR